MSKPLSATRVNLHERRIQQQRQAIIDTLQYGNLAEQGLAQYDQGMLDLQVSLSLWDQLGAEGTNLEQERLLALKRSEIAWRHNPIAALSVDTWTAWGMGDQVEVTLTNESSQPTWDKFWTADRNALLLAPDKIHNLSDWLLVKGNRFFVFFASTVDGSTTLRLLDQNELEIITSPADRLAPWFYKRTYQVGGESRSLYYPDWRLKMELEGFEKIEKAWDVLQQERYIDSTAERADIIPSGNVSFGEDKPKTDVCVMHSAHWQKDESSLWGWPLTTVAADWLVAHKGLMEAHYSVARSKALYARDIEVDGGSRAVQSVISTIQSNLSQSQYYDTNPPPAPGSSLVHNKALGMKDLPMNTGAADFKTDEGAFAWMAGAGMHMSPVLLNKDMMRYATSLSMDKGSSILFQRYSTFLSAQFQNMVKIVLGFAEMHGSESHADKTSTVSIDSLSLSDVPDMVTPLTQVITTLTSSQTARIVPTEATAAIIAELVRPILQALGSGNAADLTSDEAFEVGDFAPEEPEEQPPETPDEMPEPEEEPEEVLPEEYIKVIARNFVNDEIDLEALAENVLAELVERQKNE